MTRQSLLRGTLVVVGALPFVTWLAASVPLLEPLTAPAERWFSFQCHRDPNRSLHWLGEQAPVCSRCLAIYMGLVVGALTLRPRLAPAQLRVWVAVASLVLLLDVGSEALGFRPPLGPLRALTGFMLSWPVSVALVRAARA